MKRDIILLFENVKERIDDAKQCLKDLVPCQAKTSEDYNGIYIKKIYSTREEYDNIMKIKEKYDLKIQMFLS